MNWDELKNVWDRQSLPEWKAPDLAALEREFTTKQRKLARGLFWRDLREAGAGVFVGAVFAHTAWRMGRDGWPIALAALLVLGLGVFFLRESVRARRQRPSAEATLLVRLDAEIAEQRRQHRLLTNVATWYLGPCLLAAAIVGATVLIHAPIPVGVRLAGGTIMAVICGLTGWLVIWVNRRAVSRIIDPRLQELEQWRETLISSE